MRKRIAIAAYWVALAVALLVWTEHWQPWATIVTVIVLVGYISLIAEFISSHRSWRASWPHLLRRDRHGPRSGKLGE